MNGIIEENKINLFYSVHQFSMLFIDLEAFLLIWLNEEGTWNMEHGRWSIISVARYVCWRRCRAPVEREV